MVAVVVRVAAGLGHGERLAACHHLRRRQSWIEAGEEATVAAPHVVETAVLAVARAEGVAEVRCRELDPSARRLDRGLEVAETLFQVPRAAAALVRRAAGVLRLGRV